MAEDRWSKLGKVGSGLGEALMRIAMMAEDRKYRQALLQRQGVYDQMAIDRIETDKQQLAYNAVMDKAAFIKEGWTGTPGTQVWTEGQAPVDIGVEPPDLSGGLFDRQPTEISPVTRAAMGGMGVDVEPGATYPGPSPISVGGDPSQFGAELMQTPQLGGGFVPGSFEPAQYDPRMGTRYQDQVALNQLAAQQPPTYGVSGGVVGAQGFGTEEAASGFAARNQPPQDPATYGISAGGDVTATNVPLEDIPGLLQQFYVFDPSAPPSPSRQANLALIDSFPSNTVNPDTREWLNSLDDESVATWVANVEEEQRAGLVPGESDRRAAATVDRVLVGYEEMERIASELSGAPAGSVVGSNVVTRSFQSEDVERWRAAAIMVVGGTLRWTSGAAIGKDEIKNLSEALVPQVNEDPGTAVFKMQGLEAQIGAMVRSAALATGRDYGERWLNVGIDRAPPTVPEATRIDQLVAEGFTTNQIDWFLTMEGYQQ